MITTKLCQKDCTPWTTVALFFLQGGEVFKFAVRSVPQVIDEALSNAGMQKEQIDWLVLHQVCVHLCVCVSACVSNFDSLVRRLAESRCECNNCLVMH